jgi:hypothetical protein
MRIWICGFGYVADVAAAYIGLHDCHIMRFETSRINTANQGLGKSGKAMPLISLRHILFI